MLSICICLLYMTWVWLLIWFCMSWFYDVVFCLYDLCIFYDFVCFMYDCVWFFMIGMIVYGCCGIMVIWMYHSYNCYMGCCMICVWIWKDFVVGTCIIVFDVAYVLCMFCMSFYGVFNDYVYDVPLWFKWCVVWFVCMICVCFCMACMSVVYELCMRVYVVCKMFLIVMIEFFCKWLYDLFFILYD